MSFYDDAKYGVIERVWFGLMKKQGGDNVANTGGFIPDETTKTHVTRWYPKGPIKIKKFGLLIAATIGKGETVYVLKKNGSTRVGTVTASTSGAPYSSTAYSINSSPTVSTLPDGDYLSLVSSTNVCSSGTCAFFIDYTRMFDAAGTTWEA